MSANRVRNALLNIPELNFNRFVYEYIGFRFVTLLESVEFS